MSAISISQNESIAAIRSQRVADVSIWFSNVATSVLIVFVNKWVYNAGFSFATCLCALHFFASAITVKAIEKISGNRHAFMPLYDKLLYSIVASASIVTLNTSLLVNTVSLYQISKLLIVPFVAIAEFILLNRSLRANQLIAVLLVVLGVGIVTVSDFTMGGLNLFGILVAATSVVTSGMQQIMCGQIQRRLNLTANQMLSNTAPVQGMMVVLVGPYLDSLITNKWITSYLRDSSNYSSFYVVILSCIIASAVNLSQFMCLGRFSAVTFQVLGHTKTIVVLLLGWGLLGDVITLKKLAGMILAVLGMIAYSMAIPSVQRTDSSPKKT